MPPKFKSKKKPVRQDQAIQPRENAIPPSAHGRAPRKPPKQLPIIYIQPDRTVPCTACNLARAAADVPCAMCRGCCKVDCSAALHAEYKNVKMKEKAGRKDAGKDEDDDDSDASAGGWHSEDEQHSSGHESEDAEPASKRRRVASGAAAARASLGTGAVAQEATVVASRPSVARSPGGARDPVSALATKVAAPAGGALDMIAAAMAQQAQASTALAGVLTKTMEKKKGEESSSEDDDPSARAVGRDWKKWVDYVYVDKARAAALTRIDVLDGNIRAAYAVDKHQSDTILHAVAEQTMETILAMLRGAVEGHVVDAKLLRRVLGMQAKTLAVLQRGETHSYASGAAMGVALLKQKREPKELTKAEAALPADLKKTRVELGKERAAAAGAAAVKQQQQFGKTKQQFQPKGRGLWKRRQNGRAWIPWKEFKQMNAQAKDGGKDKGEDGSKTGPANAKK